MRAGQYLHTPINKCNRVVSMTDLLQQYLHYLIGMVLGVFTIAFLWKFCFPALRIGGQLRRAIASLGAIKPAQGSPVIDLDRVAKEVMHSERLAHCWAEYCETLHPQKNVDEYGQEQIVRWRSTALADVFFTEQALVETPLKTEFYKHLPGILTGIGIIGTFSGLILGLIDFQITEDANVVRTSLAALIQNVGQAFLVSGMAISLAMLATWIEKSLVTRRYKDVEALCQLIDSLFDAGAGEEYLARLVTAAEESATQAGQMKDSLVTDLKQILTELTNQQIQAAGAHNQQLSNAVVGAINESLKEPMAQLSAGMNSVARDQGTAINTLLTDVLAGFTAKMDDMFGAQMRGMNDALMQTSLAIQTAAGKFDQLASTLENAGQGAAEAMHQRLETMMTAMDTRQQAMNERMSAFVEQLRTSMESTQSDAAGKMQAMLAELGQQVAAMVSQLQDSSQRSSQEQQSQLTQLTGQMGEFLQRMERTVAETQHQSSAKLQELLGSLGAQTSQLMAGVDARNESSARSQQEMTAAFAMETQSTVDRLAAQVDALTRGVQEATGAMRSAVTEIAKGSNESITLMNRGAETLNTAATRFSGSLEGFSGSTKGVVDASKHLAETAQKLQAVVALSNQALNGHQAAQQAFGALVGDLKATVENASRDARLTSELVGQLESAGRRVADVQEQAEHYLESVSKVLVEAHAAFANSVKSTLRDGNKDFHTELGNAVGVLRGAILDLGDTLELAQIKG